MSGFFYNKNLNFRKLKRLKCKNLFKPNYGKTVVVFFIHALQRKRYRKILILTLF